MANLFALEDVSDSMDGITTGFLDNASKYTRLYREKRYGLF